VLVGCEGPAGFAGIQLKAAGRISVVIGGNQIDDVKSISFTRIRVREASQ